MNVKELKSISDNLFSKRMPLTSLWQEVADNFYPERADFTLRRSIGTDFAANLMTSYPVMCRRDLGNQFGTMLRPTAKPWFHIKRRYIDKEQTEAKRYLEHFEIVQRRAMYDPVSMFTRRPRLCRVWAVRDIGRGEQQLACGAAPVVPVLAPA